MKTRTLNLRAERLTELTTGQLTSVAGASGLPCELNTGICPTFRCTGQWPTFNGCTSDCAN